MRRVLRGAISNPDDGDDRDDGARGAALALAVGARSRTGAEG